ncbi:hypothetical protein A1QW_11105 [Vibrio anguillarum]|nr:hypothetical protein A1QW_11105 [Vibrio anguillarum]OEF88546.1 hypothetical protein A1QY_12300 [Vibrio anguillarum]
MKPWPEVKAMNKMPTLRMPSWGLVVKSLNLWRRRQAADDQTAEGGSQNFRIEITIPNFQLQLQLQE